MAATRAMPEPAPGDLEIIQALINTRSLRFDTEDLANPQVLAGWLAERRLLAAGTALDAAGLTQVRSLRESLRNLLRTHSGARLGASFVEAFDRRLSGTVIRLRFRSNGALDFEPAAEGLDGALDRLYLTIAFAQRDDTWRRLKVCGRKDCRQAFYDRSRNLSRAWCAPRCGNQLSKQDSRKRLGKSW